MKNAALALAIAGYLEAAWRILAPWAPNLKSEKEERAMLISGAELLASMDRDWDARIALVQAYAAASRGWR